MEDDSTNRQDRRSRDVWPRIVGYWSGAGLFTLRTSGGLVLLTPTQAAVYRVLATLPPGSTRQRHLAEVAGVPLGSLTRTLARLHRLRAAFIGAVRGCKGWTVARPQRIAAILARYIPGQLTLDTLLFAPPTERPDPPLGARAWDALLDGYHYRRNHA